MRPRRFVAVLATAAALGTGACGGGDDQTADDGGDDSGCIVGPAQVGDLLGYDVAVDDRTAAPSSCRFVPVAADEHPGTLVVVAERRLADGDDGESGYDAALAAVEAEVGPVSPLPEGAVGPATRGWVATLGRVVQVGALVDDRLLQVTVADASLDAAGARGVALRLADLALD